ncbi:MAG: hypothetical protein JNK82_16750 [Myxococcaceae bacterium]|nr:hypothetical protein [Myxococcaceae bacterium]
MTQSLAQSLQAYQRFDPSGWIDLYRPFPFWAGLIAIVAGALMMLFCNGKLFRFVA